MSEGAKRGFYRKDVTVEKVRQAFLDGLTPGEIAARFACSSTLVNSRLKYAGMLPKQGRRADVSVEAVRQAVRSGMTISQICEKFSCSATVVRSRIRDADLADDDPSDVELRSLLADGRVADIARVSAAAVRKRLRSEDRRALQRGSIDLEELRRNPQGAAVMGKGYIVCLECGMRVLRNLSLHLRRQHQASPYGYRRKWGYDASHPLRSVASTAVCESLRSRRQ